MHIRDIIDQVNPKLFQKLVAARKPPRPEKRHPGGSFSFTPPPVPPPSPPGQFSLGVAISGIDDAGIFPTVPQIEWFLSKNINRFRLAIGWNTNGPQSTPFATFDPVFISKLNTIINTTGPLGARFLLDCHTFANGPAGVWGLSSGTTPAMTANYWQQMSAIYKDNPYVIGFEIMNEPPNGTDITVVLAHTQAAIDVIRDNQDTKIIYCDGTNYAAIWDWVTGGSNPSNSNLMYTLTDPMNNLYIVGHNYFDRDGSGSHYSWAIESATTGQAPPGVNTSHTIGITRLTPFVNWASQHNVRIAYGEFQTSNDALSAGGNDNYQDWNTTLDTTLAYCQANKIECWLWGGGGDFGTTYPLGLEPRSTLNNGQKDFTIAGLQPTQWTVIDKYSGFTGSQPIAYQVDLPVVLTGSGEAITVTPNPNGTVGTPTGNFTIRYGGVIPAGVVITPHDTLMDGTSAGGTFTPSSITLPPGDNCAVHFTYTPAATNATIQIACTNNAGWINPAAIGFTTTANLFSTAITQSSVIALRRVIPNYIGPAITLINPQDGVTQQTFYFNNRGDLPRQAIQNFANSRHIPIARIYSQNGVSVNDVFPIAVNAFGLVPSLTNPPILNLTNDTVYPEVLVTSGQWMGTASGSIGRGLLTIVAQARGTGTLVTQDNFNAQFRLNPSVFSVAPNGSGTSVATGSWSTYSTQGGTFSNLYSTNNVNSYQNGSVLHSASIAPFTFAPVNGDTDTYINGFRFGGQNFVGSWQELVITFDELSSTVMGNIASDNSTYYSTPLPDTLSGVNPTITGAVAGGCIVGKTSSPFGGVTIADDNGGGVTDTVTITLTGTAGGTLSGTGLSGSNPYTLASAIPSTLTTQIRGLTYTTAGTASQTETMTIQVVSSAGGATTTNSNTVITTQAVAPPETPFAAPVGTFTPTNMSGINIIDAVLGYPDASGFNHIYPQNDEIDYWASKGFGAIRMPLANNRLQPVTYGPLDPPCTLTGTTCFRSDGDNWSYAPHYSTGTQVNLSEIKRVLDRCRGLNMYVQLEFHQNQLHDTQNNVNRTIGTDPEATNMAVDLWQRIATVFKNYDNAIFEYFNEPVASTTGGNFTCQTTIAAAVAAITTLQWNYIPTNFFSGGNTYVSRGEPAFWNAWTPPAGLKWALVLHQYLNAANNGFTADVVLGKGASCLAAACTSMRAAGLNAVLTETGWSPSDTIVSPGTGIPSVEGNAILNFCKTNNDVFLGWNYWLGGNYLFENAWNAGTHSVFSAVAAGFHPAGTIVDAPQVAVMQANLFAPESFPGQAGNLVGYANTPATAPASFTALHGQTWPGAYSSLTAWPGGTGFQTISTGTHAQSGSGTPTDPYVFSFYDFNAGSSGTVFNISNAIFVGCRFQSNDVNNYNTHINSAVTNCHHIYCSWTPLASAWTSPPQGAWPSASAGLQITGSSGAYNNLGTGYCIPVADAYQYGIDVNGAAGPSTQDHCDFWGMGNCSHNLDSASIGAFTITDCWIHDNCNGNATPPGASGNYHQDGIFSGGNNTSVSHLTMRHNTVASIGNTNGIALQTAATPYSHITLDNNYLSGYGYTVDMGHNVSGNNNMSVTNNIFGTDLPWVFGPVYTDFSAQFAHGNANNNVWSGNILNVLPGTSTIGGQTFSWSSGQDGQFVLPDRTLATSDW